MSISYPIVCPSCNGLGWINNPLPVSSSCQIQCPACKGSGTVIATEDNTIVESLYCNCFNPIGIDYCHECKKVIIRR